MFLPVGNRKGWLWRVIWQIAICINVQKSSAVRVVYVRLKMNCFFSQKNTFISSEFEKTAEKRAFLSLYDKTGRACFAELGMMDDL